MNALESEKLVEKTASILEFDINYISGATEADDLFHIQNDKLEVNAYGPTEEAVLASARRQAQAYLMTNTTLAQKIMAAYLKEAGRSKSSPS